MDSQLSKDFLSNLFNQDGQGGAGDSQQHVQQGSAQDHELQMQHALGIGLLQSGGQPGQHSQGAQPLNLDMLFGHGQAMSPMAMHDAPGQLPPAAYEQHLKLARLRQLQVQHEILQQQVCTAGLRAPNALLIPRAPSSDRADQSPLAQYWC
jgi:hypothetical protein